MLDKETRNALYTELMREMDTRLVTALEKADSAICVKAAARIGFSLIEAVHVIAESQALLAKVARHEMGWPPT